MQSPVVQQPRKAAEILFRRLLEKQQGLLPGTAFGTGAQASADDLGPEPGLEACALHSSAKLLKRSLRAASLQTLIELRDKFPSAKRVSTEIPGLPSSQASRRRLSERSSAVANTSGIGPRSLQRQLFNTLMTRRRPDQDSPK